MIGFLGKLGKLFCNIKKKYTQYFKTSDDSSFITSDGFKLRVQPTYYNFKTSNSEDFKTKEDYQFKVK